MKICVSKQSIDDCQPFEIVADIQLIRHTHTAMQLDRVLPHKFSRLADPVSYTHLTLPTNREV